MLDKEDKQITVKNLNDNPTFQKGRLVLGVFLFLFIGFQPISF